ncbi:hypothetical protein MUY14_10265 [Amycolatopsis sp. FBCC-B4732]|uniref:hypothetical protein n=1 Tax=Amycolatopsis sp. FBCC-B4732 TaxID=3079339 RepID=UPI001FF51B71|nr:hypothetical protein [Amycolatopsis sp. FBCC-B4732]UOX93197.1 hypothetical protein MUY14_10265 [Amycolatopsis sp. FBCC-B4732]
MKAAADQLVTSGLRAAGYEYVIRGDCRQADRRDADGNLPARASCPSGLPGRVDYVHSRGLKIGFYGGIGAKPAVGSLDHEDVEPGHLTPSANDNSTAPRSATTSTVETRYHVTNLGDAAPGFRPRAVQDAGCGTHDHAGCADR